LTSFTTPPSVFIRCDAGDDHGLGHVVRCLTLADAFVNGPNWRPAFVTESNDSAAANIVSEWGYQPLSSDGPAGSTIDVEQTKKILSGTGSDNLLIIDSKLIGNEYPNNFRDTATVACIDDEMFRDLHCDVLINNNIWVEPGSYGQRRDRSLLLGPKYNLVRQSFFELASNKIQNSSPRVLVTMGGEDPLNHSLWILENFREQLSQCEVVVVVGPSHPAPESIREMSTGYSALKVVEGSSDLASHMANIDIAISAGGTTCYELAAAQIGTLALAIEPHQVALVENMEKSGCLISLGEASKASVENVDEVIKKRLKTVLSGTTNIEASQSPFSRPGAPAIVEKLQHCLRARSGLTEEASIAL
jgi:UDP-2,4-diacetamido-2,4,6-trideoxy-beta-L-altropyranose hydrolase